MYIEKEKYHYNMLVKIHCATVRGLVAAGFKYYVEDKSDSINLSRQITPIISIVVYIHRNRCSF